MFIRVTSLFDGTPMYININHISGIYTHVADSDPILKPATRTTMTSVDGTVICIYGGISNVYAKEDIEYIYNQIEYMQMQNIHVREKNT